MSGKLEAEKHSRVAGALAEDEALGSDSLHNS